MTKCIWSIEKNTFGNSNKNIKPTQNAKDLMTLTGLDIQISQKIKILSILEH